ncbi:MAG TPA: hypothetical protein VKU38_10320, partial [Ktedonobacteraceae bacterium]|nr:hypothetical protein [Ktedonobacteraceae bacterium]
AALRYAVLMFPHPIMPMEVFLFMREQKFPSLELDIATLVSLGALKRTPTRLRARFGPAPQAL